MSKSPTVIGQGSYGCVHKPSLTCKDKPNQDYRNKVSKLLDKDSASKELAEYQKVTAADKKSKFYLGIPETCDIDTQDKANLSAIRKCNIADSVLHNLDGYTSVIMEDGGNNLATYRDTMKHWPKSEMSTEHCEKFLLELLRLFAGLVEFESHDLLHHDLKPQNIVYNEKNNRLNYIDFGLMDNTSKFLNDARASRYQWAIFHWSYPWELQLLNQTTFSRVANDPKLQDVIVDQIENDLRNGTGNSENANSFFYYAMDRSSYQIGCDSYIYDYSQMLKRDMKDMGYDQFLQKSIRTVDVFGLGIALNSWFYSARKHLSELDENALELIFSRMVSARVSIRLTAQEALERYERFLLNSGLLDRYDKKIENHIVVDSTKEASPSPSLPPLIFDMKFRPDKEFVEADPKPCPEGKEYNKKTRRCLVKCKDGKVRNPKTRRCIKAKN
jgi:serine/threonine protein kinase